MAWTCKHQPARRERVFQRGRASRLAPRVIRFGLSQNGLGTARQQLTAKLRNGRASRLVFAPIEGQMSEQINLSPIKHTFRN
jgi:hypothetical protein